MRKPDKDYKSIIWLRLDSIGDGILSSSMLPYIKGKFSNASVTVICQEQVAPLYESCPFVDDIIREPQGRLDASPERFRNIPERIKAKNPDLLLNSVFSTHYLSDLNGLEYIPERIAFRNSRKDSYSIIIPDKGEWELELSKHQRFLAALGIQAPALQPLIWLSAEDEDEARIIIESKKVIALFADVRTRERFYDRYWEALKGLNYFIVALGNNNDFNLNQEQLNKSGCEGINLSGKLSLMKSIAVIKLADLAIGGETGLAHAACAVGTQNVILLGGGHYGRFMPYSSLTKIVEYKMSCYRCNWLCKSGKGLGCIRKILPSQIRKEINKCLNL